MKMTKLSFSTAILFAAFLFVFNACKKDDDPVDPGTPVTEETKSGILTADETWTSDKVYLLDKKVVVDDGVTLTIEAGTIIKGKAGEGTQASALVVARGGMLMAEGTASNPIIFTSEADNIAIGETVGTNLTKVDNKLWGGLIMLGSAPISAENGDTETNIEGIPVEEGYGLYGGSEAADNSGTLNYVSIRHGGISIGDGNEINGLTLGGVGTGTSISNVEVYATLDDGIECFGGTVNIDNALVFYQGDDGIDLDMNYSGTISNFTVIHGDGIGSDEGLEIDGPEGSTYTSGLFTLSNGVVLTDGTETSAADFKSKAQGTVENVIFSGYGATKPLKFRTKFVSPGSDCSHKEDAYSHLLSEPATLIVDASQLEGVSVYDGDDTGECLDVLSAANAQAISKIDFNGAGASLNIQSVFGWTCAGKRGELTDPVNPPSETITKSGLITADETWLASNIYLLDNKVVVDEGVTLTIQAGTIVKGLPGENTLASALVVARGGKLLAEGTASRPIIFTAEADNIAVGQTAGTNLEKIDNKLWGGVIVLGSAPISAENGDTETNIEGIPVEEGYGLFGGTDPEDNSGVLRYISIRHGGISIGDGNEINGLTLGGVGNKTLIENVEVYATLDDGIECFGGTVNIDNALVFYQGDDGIDLDMNYSGTISNFGVIHGDGIGTDEGLEIDGPEGSTYTDGLFTLSNGILKSEGSEPSSADFKSKAQGYINNVTFIDYPAAKPVKIRTNFVDPGNDCTHKNDAYLHLISNPATLVFTESKMVGVVVYEGDDTGQCSNELGAANTEAMNLININGTGATIDLVSLFNWTCAGERNEL
jgi:uncharacterized membrane protein